MLQIIKKHYYAIIIALAWNKFHKCVIEYFVLVGNDKKDPFNKQKQEWKREALVLDMKLAEDPQKMKILKELLKQFKCGDLHVNKFIIGCVTLDDRETSDIENPPLLDKFNILMNRKIRKVWKRIERANLQEGDILIFKGYNSGYFQIMLQSYLRYKYPDKKIGGIYLPKNMDVDSLMFLDQNIEMLQCQLNYLKEIKEGKRADEQKES